MSLFPYALLRPALFALDPEKAHETTLHLLQHTQNTPLQKLYAAKQVQKPVQIAGLTFPNRVGMAAGLDKNALCIDGLAAMGFGFVEVGTVTPLGQSGNAKPRLFRLPQARALINRMGFNNDGLDAFVRNVQQARQRQRIILGLNIGKNASTPIDKASDDYLKCLEGVYAHADYITVNISSPNTKNLRELQNDEALDKLLSTLDSASIRLAHTHGKRKPIFLKIAPDLNTEQIQSITHTLLRYGVANGATNQHWGVIATNTTLSRQAVEGLPYATETGGLSGAPVRAASTAVIRQLRVGLGPDFPIIGVGGIFSAEDAREKIKAGADLVQIYTGLIYQGPSLVSSIAKAL
ncbi:quinone-dependent dihydroorotate dehydrogenase [Curvibacter sp. CHRR-16]|uniref:quinone-dependent dihydroorotate dehydrogenase n=1 Tax=Curvibacter sp. CHRR-16 TaxID=2835872 RepID=UPI001BDA7F80|nr:quinone-dependent dihydroorotate dehydrogenase [Curvibacter sp. CHRR-16]MBT0571185.1 quinone-dependent dihydroorotate dehydrogenase [Curvibacter sp. CHRR-16]